MEEMQAWDINIYDKVYIDIKDITEDIRNGIISELKIKEKYIPGTSTNGDFLERKADRDNRILRYTDESHPLVASTIEQEYIINPVFFEKHRSEIIKAFYENIKKRDRSYYAIPNYLYSEEILDLLLTIDGVCIVFKDVDLSKEAINKIKSKYIDASVIKNGKEEKISSKYVAEGAYSYTLKDLQTLDSLVIKSETANNISDDIIKEINDNATIKFTEPSFSKKEDARDYYQRIYNFMEKVDICNKKVTFEIPINKRRYFNEIFLDKTFNNINLVVEYDSEKYTFQEYQAEEVELDNLLLPLKGKELSPLEKYLAIYSIVKNYKKYRETTIGEKDESRNLKYILHNDFIVCRGFGILLVTLCDKMDIDASMLSVTVDTSYDKGFTEEEKIVEKGEHARCTISIDDDKYNVHGLYIADPTWDSDFEHDAYNNALMTTDKMQVAKRMFYYNYATPILDIHNFKEFNDQVNYLLKYYINNTGYVGTYDKVVLFEYKRLITSILNNISCDPKYYYFINKLSDCHEQNDYDNLLTELGKYLLTRINIKVNDEVILNAAISANKIVGRNYNEEDIRNYYYEKNIDAFPYEIDSENEHNLTGRSR